MQDDQSNEVSDENVDSNNEAPDTDVKPDNQSQPRTLEQLHQETSYKLNEAGKTNDTSDEDSDEASSNQESNDESEDIKNEENDEENDQSVEDPFPKDSPDTIEIPEAPELNTDITQAAEGKVMIVDYNGQPFYFNTADEIPEDFEPRNAKDFAIAVGQLSDNKLRLAEAEQKREQAQQERLRLERANQIREGWQAEQKSLVESGKLPQEEKARQPIIDGVMRVINEELEKGRAIGSWEQAFEIYQYRQMQVNTEKEAERKKQQQEVKKQRGSMVQSGGTVAPSGNKVHNPMPAGTTLDDVHATFLGSL